MAEIDDRLEQLQARLDNLVKYQEYFYREISQLTQEIKQLKDWREKTGQATLQPQPQQPPVRKAAAPQQETIAKESASAQTPPVSQPGRPEAQQVSEPAPAGTRQQPVYTVPEESKNVEKFVGQNLLSIVGILILVLGVGIGGKYAIDNNLISPTMRIVFGYVIAAGLVGCALYLKRNYHKFSAVLMSGAMAIMYFVTYFAYALYDLYSQTTAFALMLIFTAFTVFWALNYGKQVIAHIGLVGAYAIPFMLGGNSGNYTFLFTYIAIINFGILVVSIRKYWKWLFYNAFGFTWLIYFGWYAIQYQTAVHFGLALTFLSIFFLMFYITFLIHKLIFEENFATENIGLILANSFIFFGFGYGILKRHGGYENYLGLFTVMNAVIHFIFALVISRMRTVPRDISYLLAALVIIFVTIAIPVQFNGNWLTLVWAMECVLLFWIGRTKQISLYEYFSYPVMVLASFSLFNDFQKAFHYSGEILAGQYPLANGFFITSLLYAAAFGFIFYINKDDRYQPATSAEARTALSYAAAAAALAVIYNAFRVEIDNYFHYQMYKVAAAHQDTLQDTVKENESLFFFNVLWQMNYTMFFLTLLGWLNIRRFKNAGAAVVNLALNVLVLAGFLTAGLFIFARLNDTYLFQTEADAFHPGIFNIVIRYICYIFAAGLFFVSYRYTKQKFLTEIDKGGYLKPAFDLVFYVSLWLVLSSELINWMALGGYPDSYRLGLSLLWGIYALCLIILGIYKKQKDLRIGAIALFGLTLIKLFFYDIIDLNTISKTIIFVSLGILLLIVSFLYNKYKALIFGPDENDKERQPD